MGVKVCSISFIVLCCLCIMVHSSRIANTKNGEYCGEKKASVSEMVKCIYSISTSSPFTSEYWSKVRTLLHQGRLYLSSLNLDFKKVDNAEDNEGMGQKIKKTVVKCMDKSREAKKDDQSEL